MDTTSKPWWESKTIWIGICTTLAGIIPLVVELILKAPAEPAAITAAVASFVLGVIQIVRRVWLDPETPPAAIK